MHCRKCGQAYERGQEHICSEQVTFTLPNVNIPIPTIPTAESSAFERVTLPLSPDAPSDLTIEDILNNPGSKSGVIRELKGIFFTWKKFVKKPDKANIILLCFGLLMFLLWLWTKYYPGSSYNYMPPGIRGLGAVLLASYNNIPARILHYSSLITLITAFLPKLINGESAKALGHVKSSGKLMLKIFSYGLGKELYVVMMAFGTGLFFSNFLMRNNSSNKYAVCLTLGLTAILSTSGMFNATFVRLVKGLFEDLTGLVRLDKVYRKYRIMLQVGFGLGLVLSILISMFRSMSHALIADSLGYYLGLIILLAGLVLVIVGPKSGNIKAVKAHGTGDNNKEGDCHD